MDVDLDRNESEAVQKALTSYLSDLRMEITDTDNPSYRATLREERAALESALAKLSGAAGTTGATATTAAAATPTGTGPDAGTASAGEEGEAVVRVVRLWWGSR